MRTLGATIAFVILLSSTASSTVWEVPSATCPTIQAGIDSAAWGDTVALADGVYEGEGNYNILFHGKRMTLKSLSGNPEDCIIDGSALECWSDRGVWFIHMESERTVLDGITIQYFCNRSNDNGGAAVTCDGGAAPTIRNCIFRNNNAVSGGAVGTRSGSPQLFDCVFLDNVASNGGAFHSRWPGASPTLIDCVFMGNIATNYGGAVACDFEGRVTLTNCTLADNRAYRCGGGAYAAYDSDLRMYGCTLYGNSADIQGGGICVGQSDLIASHTIVAYSLHGEAITCGTGATASLTCCDLYGNAGGDWIGCVETQLGIDGNFSACPSLCFADFGDFRLCDESPCAPGNHPDGAYCGLIGAWPVGCACGPTAAKPSTWGEVKAMFR